MKAPFNFVPISKWIHEPDWAPFVTQDVPFSDGITGDLEFSLEAETPLLVGGTPGTKGKIRHITPFEFPHANGEDKKFKYAIPPTSLKGMIRNVIEIATFSRSHRIEDKRFGIRDLKNKAIYLKKLLKSKGRFGHNLTVTPKINAGWLRKSADGKIELVECELARVLLTEIALKKNRSNVYDAKNHVLKEENDVETRYQWWDESQEADKSNEQFRNVNFYVGCNKLHPHSKGNISIKYRQAFANEQKKDSDKKTGKLIFTEKQNVGMGSGAKKYEFFFYDKNETKTHHIPSAQFKEFLDIHEPDDGRKIHPTWAYFKDLFTAGKEIPVFWVADDTNNSSVKYLGVSYMIKIPHEHSTHQMIEHSTSEHLDNKRLDFATMLFGDKADQEDGWGLKGRVNFDFALCDNDNVVTEIYETVLMGPKPSYYPYYVRQKPDGNFLPKGKNGAFEHYASYTTINGQKEHIVEPELAGQKRYITKTDVPDKNDLPKASDDKQKVILSPVPKKTSFTGKVRFHNLRPVELGALIWAMTLGSDEGCYHSLGMGKPYGFGRIKIIVSGATLFHNSPADSKVSGLLTDDSNREAILRGYMDKFVSHMDSIVDANYINQTEALKEGSDNTWLNTPQLTELLAMARPTSNTIDFNYMKLNIDDRKPNSNEFVQAKVKSSILPLHSVKNNTNFPIDRNA